MVSALFSCTTAPDNGDGAAGQPGIGTGGSGFAGNPSTPTPGAPVGVGVAGASGSATTIGTAGSSGALSAGGAAPIGSAGQGGSAGSTSGKGGAGGMSSGGMSAGGQGGYPGGVVQPPPLTDGMSGWATRYWDCCKPACGWPLNVGGRTPIQSCSQDDQPLVGDNKDKNACESGGVAYMCHALEPWAVSDTLSYGYAAVSKGSDYCGKCYQLQFTGGSHNSNNDAGSKALLGKTMIVQAINNGGVGGDQFDLLVPGGGVGLLDACSKQWGTKDLGEQYGGFFLACQKSNDFDYAKSKACAKAKCDSVFANKPELRAGCEWFTDWFGAPDNPALTYKEVTCPDAITQNSGLTR